MIAQATEIPQITAGEVAGLAIFSGVFLFIWLAVLILVIAGMWAVFKKADKPGWAAIVPIYNTIVMLEIVGRPIWWILLLFIPFVGLVISIIVLVDLAKSYGKSTGYAIGLILLPVIFIPMLGFGSSTYQGPSVVDGGMPAAPPPAPPAPPAPPVA